VPTHRAWSSEIIALAVAAVIVTAGPADASVVYRYSGNRFPFVETGNQGSARVTGTATFASISQAPGVHVAEDSSLTVHREDLPAITISSNRLLKDSRPVAGVARGTLDP
jgi:hypothetical protein